MKRTEITAADFTNAMSHDLREAFEVLGDSKYLEVISTNDGTLQIVGRQVTFSDRSSCYNMSAIFAHDGIEYGFERDIREGCATETFFRYDTMDDARAHAVEILSTVTDDV